MENDTDKMPADVLKSLDRVIAYLDDEAKNYKTRLDCGEDDDVSNHIWLDVRRLIRWRNGLRPGRKAA